MAGLDVIVAGFGYRAAASRASLEDALARAGGGAQALAAPEDKCGGPLAALAAALGLPVIAVAPEALSGAETLTRSAKVQEMRGTGSVAEAAALAACGLGARLAAPRALSHDRLAACALAVGEG